MRARINFIRFSEISTKVCLSYDVLGFLFVYAHLKAGASSDFSELGPHRLTN